MNSAPLNLETPEQLQAGGRCQLYGLLSQAFRYPTDEFHQSLVSGAFAGDLQAALAPLAGDPLAGEALGQGLELSHEALQGHYIGLFEAGGDHGPPAPLYEAEYGGGRMKVMENVLKIYHHFGLRLCKESWDRPDHLATEFEFMHALNFQDAQALAGGKPRGAYLQAGRTFLALHLKNFVGSLAAKLGGRGVPFYSDLAILADAFCGRELALLDALLAE